MQNTPLDSDFRPDRREFIRLSTTGAIALSAASAGIWVTGCAPARKAEGMRVLRPKDVAMIAALLPAAMKGKLSKTDAAGIQETVISFDTLLADVSTDVSDQLLEAFDLLNFSPIRGMLTGQWSSWQSASVDDATSALNRLRDSRIGLLNGLYSALNRLLVSSWYMIPENERTTGYPGPPKKIARAIAGAAS